MTEHEAMCLEPVKTSRNQQKQAANAELEEAKRQRAVQAARDAAREASQAADDLQLFKKSWDD